jgi:hypothetical protein
MNYEELFEVAKSKYAHTGRSVAVSTLMQNKSRISLKEKEYFLKFQILFIYLFISSKIKDK